jgi:hypothetical protein
VHNARKRGKALLSLLLELIISYPLPESIMSLDFFAIQPKKSSTSQNKNVRQWLVLV